MNYSTTYIAAFVSFLTLGLPVFGVHITDPGTVTTELTQVVGAFAVLYTFYGRYKAGGISALGFK